jgi:L-malate glycosyltransferase
MQAYKKKILHITPHLGGGVGHVLLNYFKKAKTLSKYKHEVICLDYINNEATKITKNIKLPILGNMRKNKKEILNKIKNAEIVLWHWWNHPLTYEILVKEKLPKCRLILWSHNSGFNAPGNFTKKILKYPDLFVFTTPISFNTKEVLELSEKDKNKLKSIWSTGGIEHVKKIKYRKHNGFNIGYIGTVDYAKLHPNFLKMCKKINIPNIKFIVCGGSNEKEIEKEAKKLDINNIEFTGIISDITKYLSIFDLFGYPLAPYHYGTCDQTLAESMAAGVIPIVFANNMEKYMIKDKVTGIVVNNEEEYIKTIEELYYNKELREILSQNAKKYAEETFSVDKLIKEWDSTFEKILKTPKTEKKWDINKKKINGKDILLEALGHYGINFENYINAKTNKEKDKYLKIIEKMGKEPNWISKTKSTVHHYKQFFPNDKYLKLWSKIMKEKQVI